MAEESAVQGSALQGVEFQGNEFASLLNKEFKPKTEEAKSAVEHAVQTLAQQALANTSLISSDVMSSIEAMIAAIDKKLSEQVNAVLHHADFQKLESAWRGLHYLVNNTETDEMLKIRVMSISKACLLYTSHVNVEVWDTGAGMAASELPRVFQEFYQVAPGRRDRSQGLGMGLALSLIHI